MKQFIQRLSMMAVILCLSRSVSASDFELDGINYTISSFSDLTVTVDGAQNKEIETLTFPQIVNYKGKTLTVTAIKNGAFKDFLSLKTVSFPSTISSIGYSAFENDTLLNNVILPENLVSLGGGAFRHCKSLKKITIPNGVDEITNELFYGCKNLSSVELNENIHSIGDRAFAYTNLISISLPNLLRNLGEGSLSFTPIVSIDIPELIWKIPNSCFYNCHKLETVVFKGEITQIGGSAFFDCSALSSITLPETVKIIGESAFNGCKSLTEFTIPDRVATILPDIIWNCPKISKLIMGKSLTGLPFEYDYEYKKSSFNSNNYNRKRWIKTIECDYYYEYRAPTFLDEEREEISYTPYLTGLKEVIIEDSKDPFFLKGCVDSESKVIPAFGKINLEYMYVGRPLQDNKMWSYGSISSFSVKWTQGTGHIKTLEIAGQCTSVPYFYQKVDTLILGTNTTVFNVENLYNEGIKSIKCLPLNPPDMKNDNLFPSYIYTDAVLFVPYGTKESYMQAKGWKNFWNIIEMESLAETEIIKEVKNEENLLETVDVYSIDGRIVQKGMVREDFMKLPKGIYIVSFGHISRKVVI